MLIRLRQCMKFVPPPPLIFPFFLLKDAVCEPGYLHFRGLYLGGDQSLRAHPDPLRRGEDGPLCEHGHGLWRAAPPLRANGARVQVWKTPSVVIGVMVMVLVLVVVWWLLFLFFCS